MRDGYVAFWRGQRYEASPSASGDVRLYTEQATDGFERTGPGRYRRVVAAAEVDLRYARILGRWRGELCVVIGQHESWLRLEYIGGQAPVAARVGMEPLDHGVWQAWAPSGEVTEIRELLI